MAVWLLISTRRLIGRNLQRETALGVSLSSLVAGLLGARVLAGGMAIGRLPSFSEMIHFENGGFSFHGYLFGSCITLFAASRLLRTRASELLDAAAPAMALTASCWRIGCFLNGCCFGRTGSCFDVPLPLFESGFLLILSSILYGFDNRFKQFRAGSIAAIYISSHAAYRLAADLWRPDYSAAIYFLSFCLFISGIFRLVQPGLCAQKRHSLR